MCLFLSDFKEKQKQTCDLIISYLIKKLEQSILIKLLFSGSFVVNDVVDLL